MAITMTWPQVFQMEKSKIWKIKELEKKIVGLEEKIEAAGTTLDRKAYLKKRTQDRRIGHTALVCMLSAQGFALAMIVGSAQNRSDPSFFVLLLLFAPFLALAAWVIGRIRSRKNDVREYAEKYVPERRIIDADIDKLYAEKAKLATQVQNLKDKLVLPESLRPHIDQLCGYFENARADTFEEALALLNKDLQHGIRLSELREDLRQAQNAYDTTEEEMEEMRQEAAAAQQAENRAIWAELEQEMDYTYHSH